MLFIYLFNHFSINLSLFNLSPKYTNKSFIFLILTCRRNFTQNLENVSPSLLYSEIHKRLLTCLKKKKTETTIHLLSFTATTIFCTAIIKYKKNVLCYAVSFKVKQKVYNDHETFSFLSFDLTCAGKTKTATGLLFLANFMF